MLLCSVLSLVTNAQQKIVKEKNIKSINKMKVEIWSDVVCPFCYIGKRNYEAALAQFANKNDIEIEWKSFQLDPSAPKGESIGQVEYLSQRKGLSKEQTSQMLTQVTQMAKQVGLEYHLDKANIINTFELHRIIQLAKEKGLGDKAEETFFKTYFTETKNLNDAAVVLSVAKEIGLTEEEVNKALTDKTYEDKVNTDIREAGQIGVSGVPFFVFNRKYAVSGAQPAEAFLQTLEKSFTEWRSDNPKIELEVLEGPACTPDGECK